MDKALEAFDKAWQDSNATKDRKKPLSLAQAYVKAHPELAQRYQAMTLEEIVPLVSKARQDGDEERRLELDIWLLATYEPQQIGGSRGGDAPRRTEA